MARLVVNGNASNMTRIDVAQDNTGASPGKGLTGLTNSTTGLTIALQADNESSATVYTSAGSTIDGITTLGTYQTPTTGHIRIKEVDATYQKGRYEIQAENARYAVSGAKFLYGTLSVPGAFDTPIYIQLTAVNVDNATSLGLGNLDTNVGSRMATFTLPTNFSMFSIDGNGRVDVIKVNGTAQTAGDLAALLSTLQTSVNNLNNLSALANLFGPGAMEVPASGSIAYAFTVLIKDAEGHALNLSGNPTITVVNTAGTDRSANLSAVSHPATGQYTFTYTVAAGATQEGLTFTASGTASSDSTTRTAILQAAVVSIDTVTALAAVKAQTDKLTFDGSNNVKSTPQTNVTVSAFAAGAITAASIASGALTSVWQYSLPGSYTSGQAGYILGHLGAAADPWAIALPGDYSPGEAGYILGNFSAGAGPSAVPCTVTLKDGNNNPIVNANVWIKSGTTLVYGVGITDSSGQVHTLLVPGATYLLYATAEGQDPINGQSFTAVAD